LAKHSRGERYSLPVYRVHRLKESARQQFRWAPHTIGLSIARPKDYEFSREVEARSHYAAWLDLKDSSDPLQLGDIFESSDGDLRIYKFVGFEQVQWQVPEAKPGIAAITEPQATEPPAQNGVV